MAKTPTKITARIDYWESKGLSRMKSTKTQIYKTTVEKLGCLIDGAQMFKDEKHTMNDFRLSVNRFTLQALDPNYQPFNKKHVKHMTLSNFLYNPFCPYEFRSQYRNCLKNPPLPVYTKHPDVYQSLTTAYLKTCNNGIKTVEDLSVKDQSNLGWASNKIASFCKNRMGKTNELMGGSDQKIINAFLKACKSFVKYDPIRFDTGLLTRSWVWEKFPNYLYQQGYLLEEKPFSMSGWEAENANT